MIRTSFQNTALVAFLGLLLLVGFTGASLAQQANKPGRSYRLPGVDLKQPIIWGAQLEEPAGQGLAFGGQHQFEEDIHDHTRVLRDGKWVNIHDELVNQAPDFFAQQMVDSIAADVGFEWKDYRAQYLGGQLKDEKEASLVVGKYQQELKALAEFLKKRAASFTEEKTVSPRGILLLRVAARIDELAAGKLPPHEPSPPPDAAGWPQAIMQLHRLRTALEQASEMLFPEPPPRALSPLAYDAKTGCYLLFGGDHLDYLTADTWVFDPKIPRWTLQQPASAPPPRANHTLTARGDGSVLLSGGYTYTSSTDYVGGQYRDLDDGDWIYDISADSWRPASAAEGAVLGKAGSPLARGYRTGALHSDFFLQGAAPDAAAQTKRLAELPTNTWVAQKPPQLPQLNRDWGSAVYDPERRLILRFSGGHSAHGGSDVLHYHTDTNRWELPFPVEFPLGQLYTNTEYPQGFNFNRRPWVTGHTYQSYGYEPFTKRMLFTGQPKHTYVWDPLFADWRERYDKPAAMTYDSCFYTLTLCSTRRGLYCWTAQGKLLLFDFDHAEWRELPLSGEKLIGSRVDNSTLTYDSKRDRLYFFRKEYGDQHVYDGLIQTVDCEKLSVSTLRPSGAEAAGAISYLCQIRYDEANDLLLCGCTIAPGAVQGAAEDPAELRRTPVYDCASNAWLSARITGDDPSGVRGRNVSLGLMYDSERKLFWAVDTKSQVFALRMDRQKAGLLPLAAKE
jgi:hypothetical protein